MSFPNRRLLELQAEIEFTLAHSGAAVRREEQKQPIHAPPAAVQQPAIIDVPEQAEVRALQAALPWRGMSTVTDKVCHAMPRRVMREAALSYCLSVTIDRIAASCVYFCASRPRMRKFAVPCTDPRRTSMTA